MNKSEKIANKISKKYGIKSVDYVIVTGSGLIDSAPKLSNVTTIDYNSLGMPKSKVKGHSGKFIIGEFNNKTVALVSRIHYYENCNIKDVRLPLEIMANLNAKTVVLLTSCGALNKSYNVGDVMLIEDQINMSGINPILAMDDIKFVDMNNCYNKELRNKVLGVAKGNNINLKRGIFCQMSGPSYETKAEVEMLRKFGGDAVSMSTAHDCIIARYLNMEVLGFSVIVNACGDDAGELSHEEVLQNAALACKKLNKILVNII